MGKRLPTKQIKKACPKGTPSSAAAIMPPRSSKMGNSDTKKMVSSAGMVVPKKFTRASAKRSAIVYILAYFKFTFYYTRSPPVWQEGHPLFFGTFFCKFFVSPLSF
jgi:hypothetical protein